MQIAQIGIHALNSGDLSHCIRRAPRGRHRIASTRDIRKIRSRESGRKACIPLPSNTRMVPQIERVLKTVSQKRIIVRLGLWSWEFTTFFANFRGTHEAETKKKEQKSGCHKCRDSYDCRVIHLERTRRGGGDREMAPLCHAHAGAVSLLRTFSNTRSNPVFLHTWRSSWNKEQTSHLCVCKNTLVRWEEQWKINK